jgi:hypothetical protein
MRTRWLVPWILAGAVGFGFGVATPKPARADGFGFSFGYLDSPDVYYVPSVAGVRSGCVGGYIGAGTVGYGGYYGYPLADSYYVSTPVFVEPTYPVRYPRSARIGAYYYDRDRYPVVHRSVVRHREAGRRVYYRGPSTHRSASRSWGWSSHRRPATHYRSRSHHYDRRPSIRSHGQSYHRGPSTRSHGRSYHRGSSTRSHGRSYSRSPSIRSHGRSHYRGPSIHRSHSSRSSGHHRSRSRHHR